MAYKPGRKESAVVISDTASRVLGPEDPGARAEVEARRDREFSTMEQIGMAADMLPGGAIAVRTGEELAKVALRAFDSGGISKAIEAAAVSSKGNNTLLSGALKFIDDLIVRLGLPQGSKKVSTESLERLGQVRDAVKSVVDRTLDATASMRNQITRDEAAAGTLGMPGLDISKIPKPTVTPADLDPSKPIFNLGEVKTSKRTEDIMATKDLPPATRMSKDMPPLSGKSRIDKEGLEGLATSVEGFSSMTDDEIMYWINYNRGRPPGDADAARRAKEAMSLLMQEAKKRGLL